MTKRGPQRRSWLAFPSLYLRVFLRLAPHLALWLLPTIAISMAVTMGLASLMGLPPERSLSLMIDVISIVTGITVGFAVESLRREFRYRLAEELRREMVRSDDFLRRTLNNGFLNEFLRGYLRRYVLPSEPALRGLEPEPMLIEIGDYVYPVVVIEDERDDANSVIDVHDVSSSSYTRLREEFVFRDRRAPRRVRKYCEKFLMGFMKLDEARGRGYEDRPKYSMEALECGAGPPKIKVRLGQFYSEIATCEVLKYELARELKELGHPDAWRDFELLYNRLKVRKYIHDRLQGSSPLMDGRYRDAAIGISTLTAYKDGERGGYVLLLGVRSPLVALDPEMIHVVPSAHFDPIIDIQEEADVEHLIISEYASELFGRKLRELHTPYEIEHFPEVRFLRQLLEEGGAQLILTGLGFDLLRLRPEICTLLVIHDERWKRIVIDGGEIHEIDGERVPVAKVAQFEAAFREYIPFKGLIKDRGHYRGDVDRALNDIFNDLLRIRIYLPGRLEKLRIYERDVPVYIEEREISFRPGDITPAGMAALWLGLKALLKMWLDGVIDRPPVGIMLYKR